MRIDMSRWLISLALVSIVGCTPAPQTHDESYGAGYINVSELFWGANHKGPYPFTVSGGEISCVYYPTFGREVYFEPEGFTDESYIGTPLNKAAAEALKRDGMIPNVPYSIKKGADLSEAREIGLQVCDEQQDMLENG